ncbi:MAG: uroporphyrinogen decarboxylase family protein [Eubacteriales bacterium]|nr:uroporphyrinogen decarboxylase family protein [Eubacteriales bacterium]
MNRTQRTLAALAGERTDRPPVSFWRHLDPRLDAAAQHAAFYEETGVDFIKIMHDGLPVAFADLRGAAELTPEGAYAQAALERARRVTDALVGEAPTYFNVFSPFCLLRRVMPDEAIAQAVRCDEQGVAAALDAAGRTLGCLCGRLIRQAGCLGVFVCFQGNEQGRFSKEVFDRVVRPSDWAVLEAANAASNENIAHFCGWDGIPNVLSRCADYPAKAVNWAISVEKLGLSDGRRLFGGRPVLGGFDNRRGSLLYTATEDEIKRETHRILADYRAREGSLNGLLVGADCSFLPPIASERFRYVVEAVREEAVL